MHKVIYTEKAIEDLEDLEQKIAQRIVTKIDFYAAQKNPLTFAKKLKNIEIGEYRFRIGEYRATFDIDNRGIIKILWILHIKHRKDIYDL